MAFFPTGSILNGVKIEDIENIINEQTNSQQNIIQEIINTQTGTLQSSISSNTSGAVRRVQRGTYSPSRGGNGQLTQTNITLSGFTNADKMICILTPSLTSTNYSYGGLWKAYVASLNTSTLSIMFGRLIANEGSTDYDTTELSYQVIEFY